MIKVIARANGMLETIGAPDLETELQARIVADRVALRRMLDGGERFHVDPMAAPIDDDGTDDAIDAAAHAAAAVPTADVWHTEAPAAAGVYVADFACGQRRREARSYFDGKCWSWVWTDESDATYVASARLKKHDSGVVHWLRLISADTPVQAALQVGDRVMTTHDGAATVIGICDDQSLVSVRLDKRGYEGITGAAHLRRISPAISDWRPGDQVPEGERTGLWHSAFDSEGAGAGGARGHMGFYKGVFYRPAAPGVREGEAYDESKYGVAG